MSITCLWQTCALQEPFASPMGGRHYTLAPQQRSRELHTARRCVTICRSVLQFVCVRERGRGREYLWHTTLSDQSLIFANLCQLTFWPWVLKSNGAVNEQVPLSSVLVKPLVICGLNSTGLIVWICTVNAVCMRAGDACKCIWSYSYS